MAGGARIYEQVLVGGISHDAAHGGQAADELRDGQFELADQHTARSRDGKASAVRAGRQRQREVGDQQRFATFGSPPTNRIPFGGNSPGSARQRGAVGGYCCSSWANDRTLGSASFCRVAVLIAAP